MPFQTQKEKPSKPWVKGNKVPPNHFSQPVILYTCLNAAKTARRSELNYLINIDPEAYAERILAGNPENYLKVVIKYRMPT